MSGKENYQYYPDLKSNKQFKMEALDLLLKDKEFLQEFLEEKQKKTTRSMPSIFQRAKEIFKRFFRRNSL